MTRSRSPTNTDPHSDVALPRRSFGNHGFEVPALGLGGGPLGDERLSDADAYALLEAAVELGMMLVDTAPSYGRSEERIGTFVASRPSAGVLVSTKLGYGVEGTLDWTGPCIRGGVDQALRRLRVERLDLAFLHSCGPEVLARDDVLRALEDARRDGKVRVAGYSGDGPGLRAACGIPLFGAFQVSLSMVDQEASRATFPAGAGVIAKRALMNAAFAREAEGRPDREELRRRFDSLPPALREGDVAARTLRFAAYEGTAHCVLVGSTRAAHLRENVRAFGRGALEPALDQAIRAAWDDARWPGLI